MTTILNAPSRSPVADPQRSPCTVSLKERPRRCTHEVLSTVQISRGQKIAYVVDARYDQENEAKIVGLAQGADIFYCEAPFLEQDAGKARERYHLTARQAGIMARKAGVRELVVFHFSPRYTDLGDHIAAEAQAAFNGH